MAMIVVVFSSILLALLFTIGYAAKQRRELDTANEWVDRLLLEITAQRIENCDLRSTINAHETSLEMVMGEVERLS